MASTATISTGVFDDETVATAMATDDLPLAVGPRIARVRTTTSERRHRNSRPVGRFGREFTELADQMVSRCFGDLDDAVASDSHG